MITNNDISLMSVEVTIWSVNVECEKWSMG